MCYEKIAPQKEPLAVTPKEEAVKQQGATVPIKDAGKGYRKEDGARLPEAFYIVIAGGEKRERDYFTLLKQQTIFQRLKLAFITDRTRLNPSGLLAVAREKKKYYATSQSEENPDKIFLVSDVDDFYIELKEILPECITEKLSLIISNPCFEIWLYYGKCQPPLQDFTIPSNPLKTSQALKRYLNEKVKGGINPKWAICDVETATRNAENAYSEDKNGLPTLFSTNMFVLTEELLPLIQRGLDTLKEQRAHIASHHD